MSHAPTPNLPTLAADFPSANRDQWLALTQKVLKGSDFSKRLVARTADGIDLQPIYPRPDTTTPAVLRRDVGQAWGIASRIDHPDAAAGNALALADLDGGVNHVTLVLADSTGAHGFGLQPATEAGLEASLNGIILDLVHVRLESGNDAFSTARALAEVVARRQRSPASVSINFGLDPLGQLSRVGSLLESWAATGQHLTALITELTSTGFQGPFVAIDLRPYHEAGASEAQELSVALAAAVTYARLLTTSGMTLAQAFSALSFIVAVDADQLLGIAKLRALRRLMARVQDASGVPLTPVRIDAETAWRMMTKRDPWVNMLRTSMATFAAGIGGADSVTVLPYTLPLGLPDGFARRVARNTQVVLLEESNLWRVADPAAGSGAIEALTDDLAHSAWTQFQQIERDGGIVASLEAGAIQKQISKVRDARCTDIASRRAALTGTSEFPSLDEAPVSVLLPAPNAVARSASPLALPSHRLAAPFEALRDAADTITALTGKRPTVFLANLGPIADHSARSTWIRNLLAAGGIAAVTTGDGFDNSADVGAAFTASDARVACICGADATYAELAETVAMTLDNAGAAVIYLAGRPGEQEAALTAAGVDAFISAGQDMVAVLTEVQRAVQI